MKTNLAVSNNNGWSKESPTQDGQYWYHSSNGEIYQATVTMQSTGEFNVHIKELGTWKCRVMSGWWMPFRKPEPPSPDQPGKVGPTDTDLLTFLETRKAVARWCPHTEKFKVSSNVNYGEGKTLRGAVMAAMANTVEQAAPQSNDEVVKDIGLVSLAAKNDWECNSDWTTQPAQGAEGWYWYWDGKNQLKMVEVEERPDRVMLALIGSWKICSTLTGWWQAATPPPVPKVVTAEEMIKWVNDGRFHICYNERANGFTVQDNNQVVGNIATGRTVNEAIYNAMKATGKI